VGGERTSRPEEESAADAEDDAVLSPSSSPSPGAEPPATGMRSSRSRSRPPNGLRLRGDLSSPIALVAAGAVSLARWLGPIAGRIGGHGSALHGEGRHRDLSSSLAHHSPRVDVYVRDEATINQVSGRDDNIASGLNNLSAPPKNITKCGKPRLSFASLGM
jgi:hypothetical protein